MIRPRLPADYRDAIETLLAHYADVLLPPEWGWLWALSLKPTLTPIERSHLSVLARIALDRAAALEEVVLHVA